jgi:hypothetical protein
MSPAPALRFWKQLTVALAMILSTSLLHAEGTESLPSWLTPSLTQKIVDINMNPEQKTTFGAALTDFVTGLRDDVGKVLRRGGSNLEKKLQRAQKKRVSAFRTTMLKALDEKQHDAFEAYLSEQVEVLAEAFP